MHVFCRPEDAGMLDDVDEVLAVSHAQSPPDIEEFFLWFDGRHLELRKAGDRRGVWVREEEVRRRLKGDFLLGRACGIAGGTALKILDGMGGLGVDGLALAVAGQRVTLVEREPALWAMILDLRRRMGLEEVVTVVLADVADYLPEGDETFDVVYFDPMFAPRGKKALPGKRMQYLGALLQDADRFDPALVDVARERSHRVVLKRRLRDPVEIGPDWQIRGRSVRYDVYRGSAAVQFSRSTA